MLEDLLSRPMPPVVEVVIFEWCAGLRKLLEDTAGHPPGVFTIRATNRPAHLGVLFEDRLLALYYRRRVRYRTWKNLWARPRERGEIVVTWLAVRDPS